jgi:hypothetical protein
MAVAEDKDAASASKLNFQKTVTVLTGSMTAAGAVCGSAWYLLSPRLDKYIDDHIAEKQKNSITVAAQPGTATTFPASEFDLPGLKRRVDDLTNSLQDLPKTLGQVTELQHRVTDLTKAVTDIKAAYGYSFRFKGSDILAQQRPPSRLYFYATRENIVEVDVYLATQKFPVNLKVDGIAVRPTIRDSHQGIQITSQLVYTSLDEVTPIKDVSLAKEGAPPTIEDPRPENLHYIEFVPGDVKYQFGKDDDYDVSGILRVSRSLQTVKKDN